MHNPVLSVDNMKKFPVWVEGYRCTMGSGKACFIGKIIATTFLEACEKAVPAEEKHLFKIVDKKAYYWDCQMFDNAKDARKNFG